MTAWSKIRKRRNQSWIKFKTFLGGTEWTEWGQENDDDDEEADDYDDDECIRQGEGLCNEAQVSCFVEVSALKSERQRE